MSKLKLLVFATFLTNTYSQEYRQVQRSIQLLRNQLDKVNTLLHMEENNQDQLEQGKP